MSKTINVLTVTYTVKTKGGSEYTFESDSEAMLASLKSGEDLFFEVTSGGETKKVVVPYDAIDSIEYTRATSTETITDDFCE